MSSFELACVRLRHSRLLRGRSHFWNVIRPVYNAVVHAIAPQGLVRVINGTDRIRVSPEARGVPQIYEPVFWARLMNSIGPGDTFVDVGSFWGLYAVAVAKRVGPTGKVIAIEPDPNSFERIRRHVMLNGIEKRVTLLHAAASDRDGTVRFLANGRCDARICEANGSDSVLVACGRLDTLLQGINVDVLKIDVEGFEEKVLEGAEALLRNPDRKPRFIYLEVHPYAWQAVGTTSSSLLQTLEQFGYDVATPEGASVESVTEYGSVIATRKAH